MGLWEGDCVRVCVWFIVCICVTLSTCVCVCVCLRVCEIQTRREEGNSSGCEFYLKSCETLVNWLKRKRNLQGTDIRAIKNLPEDLTFAGSVITSTCTVLPG